MPDSTKQTISATEEWRAVVGFEGLYEVSDCGRVRSLDREITFMTTRWGPDLVTKFYRGKLLRSCATKSGHHLIALCNRGFNTYRYVHDLVLRAFVGPPDDGQECCHGDGDPGSNSLSNLRWGTRLDNIQDMVKHGTANFWGHKSNA